MKIQKILALALAFVMVCACTVQAEEEPVELVIFAAASMTETMTEIGEMYKTVAPHVTLVFNFDSSGTLKTQIEEGADCDVFISAAPKQMNALDITSDANTAGLDFVMQGTRINLLENKVALAVPEGNPKGVMSYDQLIAGLQDGTIMLAMGNSDVPVGQYTQKILAFYGVDEADLAAKGVITYGSNVKEVTTQVSEATVDCGIIYGTDAYSAGLTVVDTATAEMCGQVIYPAAVLNVSKHPDEAKAFLDYLTGPEASAVFASVGFSPLSSPAPQALTASAKGFQSDVTVTVTLDAEGKIATLTVDSASETPGFGTRCAEDEAYLGQFIGKTLPVEGVDALSGATVTSNAIVAALNSLAE